jgi:hypothetical protein
VKFNEYLIIKSKFLDGYKIFCARGDMENIIEDKITRGGGNNRRTNMRYLHTYPVCRMDLFGPSVADEELVPDLLRGKGRSVGGDLNADEEGSKQTIVTLQSLHHGFIGYQHARTEVGLAKKSKFLQMQPRTHARTRKNATKIADTCIGHECGVLQTVEWQNCS